MYKMKEIVFRSKNEQLPLACNKHEKKLEQGKTFFCRILFIASVLFSPNKAKTFPIFSACQCVFSASEFKIAIKLHFLKPSLKILSQRLLRKTVNGILQSVTEMLVRLKSLIL